MAIQIVIQFPDAATALRVAMGNGYPLQVPDPTSQGAFPLMVPNPEGPGAFLKRKIVADLVRAAGQSEGQAAAGAARAKVEAEISL